MLHLGHAVNREQLPEVKGYAAEFDHTQNRIRRLIARPGFLILLLMPLLSLADQVNFLHFGSWHVRVSDLLLVAGIYVWILELLMKRRFSWMIVPYFAILALYFVFSTIGFEVQINYDVAWQDYYRLIEPFLWAPLAITFIKSRQDAKYVMYSALLSGCIVAVSSIYLYATNPGLQRIAGFLSAADGNGLDWQGTFNEVGALHAVLIAIAFRYIMSPQLTRRSFPFVATALLLNAVGLMLDQSRSGLLAVVAIFFFYYLQVLHRAFVSGKLGWKPILSLVFLTIATLLSIQSLSHLATNRIALTFSPGSGPAQSADARFFRWSETTRIFTASVSNLMFGTGNLGFTTLLNLPTSDDFFLDHAASEGIFSLLLLILLFVWAPVVVSMRVRGHQVFRIAWHVLTVLFIVSLTGNVFVNPILGGICIILIYSELGFVSWNWNRFSREPKQRTIYFVRK